MIPSTQTCPPGLTFEYTGYIMAEHTFTKRTNYICVDKKPQPVPGSSASNIYSSALYLTEAHCSWKLPCGPVIHRRELTCVVCTI